MLTDSGMLLLESRQPLHWGSLDLPLLGILADLSGVTIDPPAGWCLAQDPDRLWFIATHGKAPESPPLGSPNEFTKELWRSDVAELFFANPDTGRYLEFNLAPNSAWWACLFDQPRQPSQSQDFRASGIAAYASEADSESWMACLSIPVKLITSTIGLGPMTTVNVTFILESPAQRFFSATPLPGPGEQPDFHQPVVFPRLRRVDLAEIQGAPTDT